ncbi:MAG: hypothetical protein ACR2RV_08575 [Verrucomicrobiales bacterium]
MERKFIITYCALAAAATLVLILHDLLQARHPATADPAGEPARLSAITVKSEPSGTPIEEEIASLEAKKHRLEEELEALRTSAEPGDEAHVPVDLETFCAHYGFVMKGFPDLKPSEALVAAIELSEQESEALEEQTENFLGRLQSIDRASMQIVATDDSKIQLTIPYRVEGREELFDELRGDLLELLGPGRARVAEETFYRHELIGSASCEKNFELRKSADGSLSLSAEIIPTLAFFPGTMITYDGTPGVEPELHATRSIKSETTIDSDSSDRLLGGLIDLERWRARTDP